jgi:secreted trypsin-like serine protease
MNTLIRLSFIALAGAALTQPGGARASEITDALRGLAPSKVAGEDCASRIVGGSCAAPGEFPWQVVLYSRVSKNQMFLTCGASLVAPNWVLTAASCVTGTQPEDWTVVSDVKKAPVLEVPSDATTRAVKRIIVHEGYDAKSIANDIALVELVSPLTAKPIPLQLTADPAVEENHDVTITGWGYTRGVQRKADGQGHPINDDQGHPIFVDTETGERVDPLKVYSPDLRKATMPLVPTAECASNWEGSNAKIDQHTLCAAQPEGGAGECMGDYGGPAVVSLGSGEWRQVGISSWGPIACGVKGLPSVFTRVSAFADWIQQKMGGRPSGSSASAIASRPPAGDGAGDNSAGLSIAFDKGDAVAVGDVVSFVATTEQPGYLTIFDVGPDGKLTQVFPNAASLRSPTGAMGATRLDPSQPVVVPDYRNPNHGFSIRISEPRGEATMAAVLTEERPLTSVDTPPAPKTFDRYDGLSLLSRIRDELAGRMRSVGDRDHPPWSIAVRKYTIR